MSQPPDQPGTDHRRRFQRLLLLALVVRVVTVLPALHSPPFSDEIAYHGLAERLADGQGFCGEDGRPTSWRPPLWPGLLSLVYRVTGPSSAAGRLFQVVLGTLLVGLIMLLAGTIDARPQVVRIAGLWAALSPTLLYFSHNLFSETLFGLSLGVAVWALLNCRRAPTLKLGVLAGVALGLACLCRGSTLLLVPPALVWVVTGSDWRLRLRPALTAGLLCGLVILPWTSRNYGVHGGLLLIDSNGAVNLFYGNHSRTPRFRAWEAVELDPKPWPSVPPGTGEIALQRKALAETVLFIKADPWRFLSGMVLKTGNLWGLTRGLPGGVGSGLYGVTGTLPTLLAAGLAGAEGLGLLLLGVLGMALSTKREPVEVELLLIAYLTLVHAPSYGHSRYRFGALLLLFGFAALALVQRTDWRAAVAAWSRRKRQVVLIVSTLLVLNTAYEVLALELYPRLRPPAAVTSSSTLPDASSSATGPTRGSSTGSPSSTAAQSSP